MKNTKLENVSGEMVTPFDEKELEATDKVGIKDTESPHIRVYAKKSTFKGAKDTDMWYSGTLSSGNSVTLIFKCKVPEEIGKAFDITKVVGTAKRKEVVKNNETYINFTYYVTSCEFHEIKGEELPL